jgi:hypothetical protein
MGGLPDKVDAWDFLQANLLTIGFFFDAVVLNDRLPLFNYAASYDASLNFDQRAFAALNDMAEEAIIAPVEVGYAAYVDIKARALRGLEDRLTQADHEGGAWLPMAQAKSLIQDMSQSAYRWEISLEELEQRLPTEMDKQIARLLVGVMIFGQYADLMQSEHWLQPKKASLFARAASGDFTRGSADEQQLFEWVAKRYGLPMLSTSQPTFFQHILERSKKLDDIPRVLVQLRKSGAVRDYRAWRKQALQEWRQAGGLSNDTVKTIKRLQAALARRELGVEPVGEAGVALVDVAVTPDPVRIATAASKTVPLLGWMMDHLPGRRHVKLLADCLHARDSYPQIERAVWALWAS